MTEVKADEVSLVDDLSDHAAAPTAAGTVPSLTTAAQAVIHGEISPMLLEACHAAAEAEFGTAVDDVDQGTTEDVLINSTRAKKRESIATEDDEPRTAKRARTRAEASRNTSDEEFEAEPSTAPNTAPKAIVVKTPRTTGTPKTPKPATTNDEGVQKGFTPRKRGPVKSPEGIAPSRGIPTSWETASEADRKLVEMKEAKKSWGEIREMWKALTGQATADSTLPNRYNRLKVNLARLEPGHDVLLMAALVRYEHNRWQTIAQQLEQETKKKYTAEFLRKEFEKLRDTQANSTLVQSVRAAATMMGLGHEKSLKDKKSNSAYDDEYDPTVGARSDASYGEDELILAGTNTGASEHV